MPLTEEGVHWIRQDLTRDLPDRKDEPLIRSPGSPLRLLVAAVALASLALAPAAMADSPRSGELHVTKECSQYFGQPGEFCTIVSSNVSAITPGSKVFYFEAATANGVDSDLAVYAGPGNVGLGHVVLPGTTGVVTLRGGRGAFRGFQARVVVTQDSQDPNLWHWDGTYRYRGHGH